MLPIFFGFVVVLVLSVIWLMTRSKGRPFPRCREDVRTRQTRSRKRGYDFAVNLAA